MVARQPSWKRQLILALVLFILGSFAYWAEFKHKPKEEEAQELSKKLFSLKDTPVSSIQIFTGKLKLSLSCMDLANKLCKPGDNSKWQIEEPLKTKADDSNTNALISSLNNLSATETIDLKDETAEKRANLLKEYGLDSASTRSKSAKKIFLSTPNGTSALYLGTTHPVGDTIFSALEQIKAGQTPSGAIDETKVYLLPGFFKSNLEHDLTYWRDKKLIPFSSHDITAFKLDHPKAHLSVNKKDGNWVIHEKSGDFPGDNENIESLLSGVTYLTAKDFVADSKTAPKAKTALRGAKQVASLKMEREKAEPVTLVLFEKKGTPTKVYATVSNLDPVYELDPSAKDRLSKSVNDLRLSKLLSSMDRFSIKKIEVTGKAFGKDPLVLVSKDGKWSYPSGAPTEINQEKVQGTLDKLTGNRIKDFLPAGKSAGNADEGIELKLGDESTTKHQIQFWKSGDKLYARETLGSNHGILVIDGALANDLPWDRGFYKK